MTDELHRCVAARAYEHPFQLNLDRLAEQCSSRVGMKTNERRRIEK